MVLVLAIGDLHVPYRALDLPKSFRDLLTPGKVQRVLCTGNVGLYPKSVDTCLRHVCPNIDFVSGVHDVPLVSGHFVAAGGAFEGIATTKDSAFARRMQRKALRDGTLYADLEEGTSGNPRTNISSRPRRSKKEPPSGSSANSKLGEASSLKDDFHSVLKKGDELDAFNGTADNNDVVADDDDDDDDDYENDYDNQVAESLGHCDFGFANPEGKLIVISQAATPSTEGAKISVQSGASTSSVEKDRENALAILLVSSARVVMGNRNPNADAIVLAALARRANADIVVCGGTMLPSCAEHDGVLVLRPGSATLGASFMLLDIRGSSAVVYTYLLDVSQQGATVSVTKTVFTRAPRNASNQNTQSRNFDTQSSYPVAVDSVGVAN